MTETLTEFIKLEKFLCSDFPQDVMMPVKQDSKQPAFPHKNDAWNWSKWQTYNDKKNVLKRKKESTSTDSVCILLSELCVIDVDDVITANDLETCFPILKTVAMERTNRGFHYWFKRPAIADSLGYFDGAAQREPKIDFKSICSTGTSGVILVAPSPGKTWIRSICDPKYKPFDMPDDLIHAVACPRYMCNDIPRCFTLAFDDGDTIVINNNPGDPNNNMRRYRFILGMEYFEPYFSSDATFVKDGGFISEIKVPCDITPFKNLMFVLQTNSLGIIDPSTVLIDEMIMVADKLGLPQHSYRRLQCGLPRFQLDMYEICPEWWRTLATEKLWQYGRATDDDILINVNDELAETLCYTPFQKTLQDVWLFPYVTKNIDPSLNPNDKVIVDNPALQMMKCIDPIVIKLLQKYPGNLILAGGMPLGILNKFVTPGSDYDLFVCGLGSIQAGCMVDEIKAYFKTEYDGESTVTRTGNALTIMCEEDLMIQIIFILYDNVTQIVVGFDHAPSKVAVYYSEQKLHIVAAPSWIPAMRHMAFPIDQSCWGYASLSRIVKYFMKGFNIALPGLRRDAIRNLNGENVYKSSGIIQIFKAEEIILTRRKQDPYWSPRYTWMPNSEMINAKITIHEYEKILKIFKYGLESDYGLFAKTKGTLKYIMTALKSLSIYWFSTNGVHAVKGILEPPYIWHICEQEKQCMAMINSVPTKINEAYVLPFL